MARTFQLNRNGVAFDLETRGLHATLRGENGAFSGWNLDHWMKIKQERERLSLDKLTIDDSVQHPLTGKTLRNVATGRQYVVERVARHWWFGSYLTAVLCVEGTKSHATQAVENINCILPTVLENIREFQEKFEVID